MTDTSRNIETVKSIYAAFGRGDVPAILETLAEDVEWEPDAIDHGIPWIVPGRGRATAARFFEALRGFDVKHFGVRAVMGDGDLVVGLVEIDFVWKPTGKRLVERCEAHIWRFDAKGRVASMKHAADTHQHWLVSRPG